jgi:hypothetical protein
LTMYYVSKKKILKASSVLLLKIWSKDNFHLRSRRMEILGAMGVR